MTPLKLLAVDDEDLKVVSAHLQDAVLRIADMVYLPRERRFAAVVDRFDWIGADRRQGDGPTWERRRAALRIERVEAAQVRNLAVGSPGAVELLALDFEAAPEPPGGFITLIFAGGSAVRLHVECIDASLTDLGPCWRSRIRPAHQDVETADGACADGEPLPRSR